MQRNISKILGILVGGLAVAHLFTKNDRLFGKLNVDQGLTMARLPIALSLLHAGFMSKNHQLAKKALGSVGLSYIGMGLTALADRHIGGMAPRGFSNSDIAFHLLAGTGAVLAGLLPAKNPQNKKLLDTGNSK